jgi:hypothetical protein
MILKSNSLHAISSIKEFSEAFDCKQWIEDNIHLYEDSDDPYDLLKNLVVNYIKEDRRTFNILFSPDGKIIVEEIKLSYVVVGARNFVLCNSLDEAKEIYIQLAISRLKGLTIYKNYPPNKINYDVLQNMIKKEEIELRIIHKNTKGEKT